MTLHIRSALIVALAVGGFYAQATAATSQDSHSGHAAASASAAADMALADGVVKKIDKASNKVTLSHGPLPGGMPAMTMAYRVKEAAWIDQMKQGQKIRFAADQINGAMTVVRFESAK